MAAQAKKHVRKCHLCLAFKVRQQKSPLKNIVATHSLELVHLDYLYLEPGKDLEEKVLLVTDHFTRYTQAYVTKTQTNQMMPKPYGTSSLSTIGYPKRSSWIKVETSGVSW